MRIFNIYKGRGIIPLTATSFIIANINSYLWNKYWTFGQREEENIAFEYTKFLIISGVALGINLTIVYLITTFIPPMFGISPTLWANGAKALAVAVALMWNFFCYKFIVFKK
jgi:putative flippase GtrA